MPCTCQYGGLCIVHPKCPWCGNYTTVFASANKEFSCTRCKKMFDRKTVVNPPSTKMASKDKNIMAKTSKKQIVAKKSSKTVKAERASNLTYEFVRMPKDAPSEDTVRGCVLAAMRKAKKGTLDDVFDSAKRCGLLKLTDQDPKIETRKHLRFHANDGSIKISRNGDEVSARKVKKGKGGKKSFKLVKK